MDFIKYQTTDDIIGFSFTGPRQESDYDTYYALHDNIEVRTRGNRLSNFDFPSLLDTAVEKEYMYYKSDS